MRPSAVFPLILLALPGLPSAYELDALPANISTTLNSSGLDWYALVVSGNFSLGAYQDQNAALNATLAFSVEGVKDDGGCNNDNKPLTAVIYASQGEDVVEIGSFHTNYGNLTYGFHSLNFSFSPAQRLLWVEFRQSCDGSLGASLSRGIGNVSLMLPRINIHRNASVAMAEDGTYGIYAGLLGLNGSVAADAEYARASISCGAFAAEAELAYNSTTGLWEARGLEAPACRDFYNLSIASEAVNGLMQTTSVESGVLATAVHPADGAYNVSRQQAFQWVPYSSSSLLNCSLFTNESGALAFAAANASPLISNTVNSIEHVFPGGGSYLWYIKCFSDMANNSALGNRTLNLAAGPAIPVLLNSSCTGGYAQVSWASAAGVAKYAVFRNGANAANQTGTNYLFAGPAGTGHNISVAAYDADGLTSESSWLVQCAEQLPDAALQDDEKEQKVEVVEEEKEEIQVPIVPAQNKSKAGNETNTTPVLPMQNERLPESSVKKEAAPVEAQQESDATEKQTLSLSLPEPGIQKEEKTIQATGSATDLVQPAFTALSAAALAVVFMRPRLQQKPRLLPTVFPAQRHKDAGEVRVGFGDDAMLFPGKDQVLAVKPADRRED